MPLTHFFLRNRRFSLVAFLFLLALGARAFRTIPLSEDPALEIPRYDVIAIAPGQAALDMEKLVVRPLEDAMGELEEVKRVTATIRDSVAQISIEFTFGSDTSKKYDEVFRQVNATRPRLPSGLVKLDVLRGETTNVAVMQIALVSPHRSLTWVGDVAEILRRRMERVSGVKKVAIHALPKQEARVSLKMEKLAASGIPMQQLPQAIQAANVVIPAGAVEIGDRRVNLETGGGLTNLDQLRDVPLGPDPAGHGIVRLRDVAEVGWDFEEQSVLGRYNGDRAVFLTVMMRAGANISAVSDGVRRVLDDFRRHDLPEDMRLEAGFDQSKNVARRMSGLERDFVIALLLVLVSLAPLGLRSSVIVMISIPLCLALAVAALQFCGFSLNQLSIVGCVIALGLLVDDSIVVVENIARFRREGHSAMDAARLATRQIAVAVVGTTATLIFAFLPLLMLPEAAGLFIRSLPAAVVFAVLASLFVALSIVPWLASMMLGGKASAEGNAVLRVLHRLIAGLYRPVLRWCMNHRAVALLLAALICVGSLALVPSIGFSLFPRAETPQLLVRVTAEEGASVARTSSAAAEVEKLLLAEDGVHCVFTTVGEGNPRVYYNVFPEGRRANIASLFVCLDERDGKRVHSLIEALRTKTALIAGARVEFIEFENGPPVVAPIEVRVIGDELTEGARAAESVAESLREVPGVRDVVNPVRMRRSDMEARLDDDKLAALGVSKALARQSVRLAFAGLNAGTIRVSDGQECAIRLCLPEGKRATLTTWDDAQVPLPSGKYVPVSQLAHLEFSGSPTVIERRDHERFVRVTAQVGSGLNVDRVTQAARERLAKLQLPKGFRLEFGGEEESRQESFAGFGNAILLAVFGIMAVLVLEFKNFRGTIIVASVIPLGVVGGLVGLWLTGYSLSFTAIIGFIALIGIEIKNSILLVDFTNQLRRKGSALDEAIAEAGEVRFLPVVLTTLTALGALLPLALEHSALYSPLAVVIIGGSLSSLLLSRLVTPLLYRVLPPQVGG